MGDGLEQVGPVLKDHIGGDGPQVLEEAVCGAAGGDRLSPAGLFNADQIAL
jgi:hypothetical protein